MDIDSIAPLVEKASKGEGVPGWPAGRVEKAEMAETERRLRSVLRPAEPSPFFREELGRRLARASRRDPSPVRIAAPSELPREVLLGAALLSVAGAIVYLWRTRLAHSARGGALLEKSNSVPVTAT